jgi:hypothetical protein
MRTHKDPTTFKCHRLINSHSYTDFSVSSYVITLPTDISEYLTSQDLPAVLTCLPEIIES